MLLSKNVGSTKEFANEKNSTIFDPNSKSNLQKSFIKAIALTNKQLDIANKESEKLASSYKEFIEIVNKFEK